MRLQLTAADGRWLADRVPTAEGWVPDRHLEIPSVNPSSGFVAAPGWCELHTREDTGMIDQRDPRSATIGAADAYRRNTSLALPFMLLVPLAFALWFHLWRVSLSWPGIGAGALGWYVAFLLRTPVALVARRLLRTPERVQPWVTAASGPAEESARLIILLLVGRAFPIALSVGLGWTAIEIVYTIINGLVIAWLLRRTDEQARRTRELLVSMGLGKMLSPTAPALGVIERVAVSALHIGFTLLLAWQPPLGGADRDGMGPHRRRRPPCRTGRLRSAVT